jgi:hypothetical protein
MATTEKTENTNSRPSLRDRLKQDSEQLSVLASAETVEKLTTLLRSLSDTSEKLVRALDETADRSTKRLAEIVESVRRSAQEMAAAATRLADLQKSLNDAERNLTYQVERVSVKRIARSGCKRAWFCWRSRRGSWAGSQRRS